MPRAGAPGSYDASLGNPSYQNDAAYYQDSLQYSIMSYFNAGYTGADTKGVWLWPDGG